MKIQGTISTTIDNINRIWPFQSPIKLVEDNVNDTSISIVGLPDFSFEIIIDNVRFISQPVVFSVFKFIVLCITWDFGNVKPINLYFDGVQVKSIDESAERLVITHPPTSYNINQNTNNDIKNDAWRNWRIDLFNRPAKENEKRIRKSVDEQFEELRLSIFSLKSHLVNFKENQNLLLFNILPILRSLLYWQDKPKFNPNYNPLLFRLAGCLNQQMNLYSFPEEIKLQFQNLIEVKPTFSSIELASIEKTSPVQKLIDFQEWLTSIIIFEKSNFTYQQIIGYAASTMSFAHFDVDTHLILKELVDKRFFSSSMLLDIVIRITSITIYFGEELLKNKQNEP